jgi:4-aminobutyrate aminotransferase
VYDKSFGVGIAHGPTVANAKVINWTGRSQASTFGGNPLSCATAVSVIETIKAEKLLENANKQGAYALKRLGELRERSEIVGDVRGKELIISVELVENKEHKKPAIHYPERKCWMQR